MSTEEEKRFFHLLQFLSFIKSLGLNLFKDCKTLRVKKQDYYRLKFPLSKFVRYTGVNILNKADQKKVLDLQEFFNTVNVSNKHLINIKEHIIRLLKELVTHKIIHNQLEIVLKNGIKEKVLIKYCITR